MNRTAPARRRARNPRGQGERLRDDIVEAGVALLEETGRPSAVTLRAVARHVGIAAPSIYGHFPDRDAMHDALRRRGFERLIAGVGRAIGPIPDDRTVERLRAGCRAYMAFAAEQPELYRFMFGPALDTETGRATPSGDAEDADGEPATPAGEDAMPAGGHQPAGEDAFQGLVGCIAACAKAGTSASSDPTADATNLWVAMHGLAILRASLPGFHWPDPEVQLDGLIDALARLR